MIADSFLCHRDVGVVVAAFGVATVAAVVMFHTRDARHLSGLRVEDAVLAVAGAWSAGLLARELHLTPALAIGIVGALGGTIVRQIAGTTDCHGAPICVGAFVGGTSGTVFGGVRLDRCGRPGGWSAVVGELRGMGRHRRAGDQVDLRVRGADRRGARGRGLPARARRGTHVHSSGDRGESWRSGSSARR